MAKKDEIKLKTLSEILFELGVSDDVIGKLTHELLSVTFLDIYEEYKITDGLLVVTGLNDNSLEINLKKSTLTQYEVIEGPVRVRNYSASGFDTSLIFEI